MNKEQTKLPEAIEEILDSVAEHMGFMDVGPSSVSPYVDYGDLASRSLNTLREIHAIYTFVQSTEWQEIQRLQREEKERLEAERWEKSRDNIMVGIINSLTMKFRKAFPEHEINFTIDNEGAFAAVTVDGGASLIEVEYASQVNKLFVFIDGDNYAEDIQKVSGNQPPVEQFKGLAAVYAHLAEIEKKEN